MFSASLLCLLLAATPEPAAAALQIPFEKYTLPNNGLEVILSEDHALPIAAVNLWYHAGPINEPSRRTGFAHLFEHLMFQGSGHVGDDQHFKLLESSGASLINGTTDFDRTNYFETVPANELELALWLESDRMGFLLDSLNQQKLDNQRQVVMNERRQSIENAPYGPSSEKLVQTLFTPDHPYFGYVMGSMDDLAAATLDDVRAFYSQFYAPANATLVIAGDFDRAQVKKWVEHYFGTLARRDAPPSHEVTTTPLTTEKRVTVHEPVSLPRVEMAWLSPAAYRPEDADADILAIILGDGDASRLHRSLVYTSELAQEVSVRQESQALVSIFTVTLTGRAGGNMAQLEAEAQKELERIRHVPPSAREVERARNQIKTRLVSQMQSLGGFGGKADMLNRYNQYMHDPGYLAADIARYDAVTPESVQLAAFNLLSPTARAVVNTVPVR
jgi:zinc protease